MRVRQTVSCLLASAGAVALCATFVGRATAVPVSYTIDPLQSSLTIVGDVLGVPVVPQVPGSATDSYSGTINADLTAGVLTFTGGSSIVAAANPVGPFLPPVAGNVLVPPLPPGPYTDNYGVVTTGNAGGLGIISIAFRNIVYDLTTGTASNGVAPAGMTVQFTAGFATLSVLGNSGLSPPYTGGGAPNSSALLTSLTTVGNTETLILPIRRESGTATHFIQTGFLVATRQVPEPSTLALAGLGLSGLALAAWKKRRA